MNKRKEYLITIFIKKATMHYSIIISLEKSFELFKNLYTYIKDKDIEELKNKFTIEKYIERISPSIDEMFSEQELQEVIDFYSSKTGSKLFDNIFLNKIEQAVADFASEIEREFSIKNERYRSKNT